MSTSRPNPEHLHRTRARERGSALRSSRRIGSLLVSIPRSCLRVMNLREKELALAGPGARIWDSRNRIVDQVPFD